VGAEQPVQAFIGVYAGVARDAVVRTSPTDSLGGVTTARYLEIADELATELRGAAPGAKVDGEHGIGRRFGVGRAAARAALQELERRLLVRRVQGAGTFVNRRIDYTISHDRRPSWHETVAAAGGRPRSIVPPTGSRDVRPMPASSSVSCVRPVAGSTSGALSPEVPGTRRPPIHELPGRC